LAFIASLTRTSCRDLAQLLREWDQDRVPVYRDQLLPTELTEEPGYGLACTPNEVGQLDGDEAPRPLIKMLLAVREREPGQYERRGVDSAFALVRLCIFHLKSG